MGIKGYAVPIEKLRKVCDPSDLGFNTTEELKVCTEIIGQKRAVNALRLGLEIPSTGYNIFVTGIVGTGRTTTVKCLLDDLEKNKKTPDDILYVNNFTDPDAPCLLRLPAGQGARFAKAMDECLDYLLKNIPLVLESDKYQERKNTLVESFKEKSAGIAREFEKRVQAEKFSLLQLIPAARPELVYIFDNQQLNLAGIAALFDDKKITEEEYEQIREKYLKFSDQLDDVFKKIRAIEKETRQTLSQLDQDTVKPVITEHLKDIRESFKYDKINEYLDEVEKEILSDFVRFVSSEEKKPLPYVDEFIEFRVNVLVDNSKEAGAPVIFENTPTIKIYSARLRGFGTALDNGGPISRKSKPVHYSKQTADF